MNQNKEAIAKAPSGRVTRTPVGTRNVLTVQGTDPNYVYRVVNDIDDRIARFQDAGYELVSNDTVDVGDKRVQSASSVGSSVKQISVGQGTKAFVMKQKREWYDADQADKQALVTKQELATKDKALDGTYGKLEISRD